MAGEGNAEGGDDERKWEDRWDNGEMNRWREKGKENTGVDGGADNRVRFFKNDCSKMLVMGSQKACEKPFPNVSHPI